MASRPTVVPGWGMQLREPPHMPESNVATVRLVGPVQVVLAGVVQSTWNLYIWNVLLPLKRAKKLGSPAGGYRVVRRVGVAGVLRLAGPPEAAPDAVVVRGAEQRGAALIPYLVGEVDHLHVVVGADVAIGVGRVDAVAVVDALEVG